MVGDAGDAVALVDLDARRRGEIDERGVELDAGRHRGVQALTLAGSGTLDGRPDGARSTAASTVVNDGTVAGRSRGARARGARAWSGRRRSTCRGERRLVDDDDVASGPAQLDRGGHAGRTGADDEDVARRGPAVEVTRHRIADGAAGCS